MVVTVGTQASVTAPPARGTGHRFRGEIQGLRAIAVLSVLGYHAGVPGMSGGFVGVDVFFVISGYLITGLVLREVATTGRLNLTTFWARRARRLLPATAVVLVTVALFTLITLPATRWAAIARDLVAASGYALNWRLAQQSTDYLASDDAASPVQHFWSLAVEEQVYVIWPILIIGLVAVRRRTRWRLRATLLAGLAFIAVPSLVWSIHLTATAPGPAYFVSTTRAWELAIGAGLAIVPRWLLRPLPRAVAEGLGWAGLATIAVTVVRYDGATAFPGYAALLPTIGAAACIMAGEQRRPTRIATLLGIAPMRAVGALSYSLYLWHWPILVSATALWASAGRALPTTVGVAVVGASVLPAWLTYRFVEGPLHRSPRFAAPRPAAVLAAACAVAGLAAAGTVAFAVDRKARQVYAAPCAAVLADDSATDPDGRVTDRVEHITPDPVAAGNDQGSLAGRLCMQGFNQAKPLRCQYGSKDAPVTIAVYGDSKMHQWLPALQTLADEHDWRLLTSLKSACPLVRIPMVGMRGGRYDDCATVNAKRYQELLTDSAIDYVFTSQHSNKAYLPGRPLAEAQRTMADDLSRTWKDLTAAGKKVVVMLDNPDPQREIMECVARHTRQLSACAFPRAAAETASGQLAQRVALRETPGVRSVDLADWICPGDMCPPVIGDVLVYRQGSHLTATYVRSLTPRLDAALARAMR